MQGEQVLKNRNRSLIDEMFLNGHTAAQISAKLKQVEKEKNHQVSVPTLQYYRKNFLQMSRQELNKRRNDLLVLGNKHDATVINTFEAAKDFIDAKKQHTLEIQSAINEFKTIKDKVRDAISLIEKDTVDDQNQPVFVARNMEILEKLLGRLESANNSFIKSYKEISEDDKKATNNISITVGQVEKQAKTFQEIIKRILMELDPNLVSRFFNIYKEEMNNYYKETGQNVNITISSTFGDQTNNINISTNGDGISGVIDEAITSNEDLSNENTMEHIIEIPVDPILQTEIKPEENKNE
jgi:hypothetical protein